MSIYATHGPVAHVLAERARTYAHTLRIYPQHEMFDQTVTVYQCVSCGAVAQVAQYWNRVVLRMAPGLSEPCAGDTWDTIELAYGDDEATP